ncbi:MAG: pilus assembly protein PilM [Desulfuromonadales bacterium]|nr:pilus assembly protein PilM [Desulfuromonadales bacterium]
MIYRDYLGLDVSPAELRVASLRRKRKGAVLTGGRAIPLASGVITPSVREPNIRDPQRFTEAVQELLRPLAGREERISLSLPETAGRILLTEMETTPTSRNEGVEALKWQLKSSLPGEAKEVHLDYQVLEKSESGRLRLVVTVIARSVLQQYEELLAAAGFNAAIIDFHCHHLYNYYRSRLEMGDDFVLVGIENKVLSLQYFQGRVLTFHRSREVESTPVRIFQELNRSLVSCQENFPVFRRAAVFVHCDSEERLGLLDALRSAFEQEVISLDPHLAKLGVSESQQLPRGAWELVAAVGAAERMM